MDNNLRSGEVTIQNNFCKRLDLKFNIKEDNRPELKDLITKIK